MNWPVACSDVDPSDFDTREEAELAYQDDLADIENDERRIERYARGDRSGRIPWGDRVM